jgi:ABC-2 type transport system permease protein
VTATTQAPPASPARERWSPFARYRHTLWLLTTRDLKVRYSTSALGYVWSILDPLLMALIYWFVFTQVFHRGRVGEEPYIVFLLTGLLPWTWFNGSVTEATRAFTKEAKLIRSTNIPRTIWVVRLVASKGIEFLFSIPVIAIFAIASLWTRTPATLDWHAVYLVPLGLVLQAVLTIGVSMIVAPLVVFFRDLERAVKLVLRLLFYASPIIYAISDLHSFEVVGSFNPLAGIFTLYRAAFFPAELTWYPVVIAAGMSLVLFGIGLVVFRASIRRVLKEI